MPASIFRTVDYLTSLQIDQLIAAAKDNRHALRDRLIILLAFRHGLRVSEIVALTWQAIDLSAGKIYISRSKNGVNGYHLLQGDEIRYLRRLQRESTSSRFIFIGERGDPLSTRGISQIIKRVGNKLGWDISPHILRHSCGYHLANQGLDTRLIQDYLGHKNIASTVIYTRTNPERYNTIKW